MTELVDQKYYQAVSAGSLAERLLVRARRQIYRDFLACCGPGPDTTILDFGVSDVVNDGANLLERQHPHPSRITAVGLGEGAGFRSAFPEVRYHRIGPHQSLPFADGSFDVAVSNAVIEHLGGAPGRERMVSELRRVARQVFVTAPNRYFPVEHHTAIPILHYWDASFRVACRVAGRAEWLDPDTLTLIDRSALERLAPEARTGHTGLKLGAISSNLYLHIPA